MGGWTKLAFVISDMYKCFSDDEEQQMIWLAAHISSNKKYSEENPKRQRWRYRDGDLLLIGYLGRQPDRDLLFFFSYLSFCRQYTSIPICLTNRLIFEFQLPHWNLSQTLTTDQIWPKFDRCQKFENFGLSSAFFCVKNYLKPEIWRKTFINETFCSWFFFKAHSYILKLGRICYGFLPNFGKRYKGHFWAVAKDELRFEYGNWNSNL